MAKRCILAYTSLTGNTKQMAEAIKKGVQKAGCELVMKEMYQMDVTELSDYDCILLGSSTWGEGDLPFEALDFYEELDQLKLTGKKAAVFGSCDSNYEHMGAAVDLFCSKLQDLGAKVVAEGLKVEGTPSKVQLQKCMDFGRILVENNFGVQ